MTTPTASGWHIHVYAGQSNECEVGLGPWTDTSSAYDSRIFQVGRFSGNDMQIIPAVRPLDYWTAGGGHGSGLSRARLYVQNGHLPTGYNLLIVPAAKGSTSVLHWDGTVADPDGNDLFGDMTNRVNLGLALPNASVTMFVWRQIEADVTIASNANNPDHALMPDAHTWYTHTLALMDRVRTLCGSCPIIYTKPTDDFGTVHAVKAQFLMALDWLTVARPQSAVTETIGLGTNALYGQNGIHFNADSQEIIAARNITAYEQLSTKLRADFTGSP